jgi:hypothetical protein
MLSTCSTIEFQNYRSYLQANWPNHKVFCKGFRLAMSSSSTTRLIQLHSSLADDMLEPSAMSLFILSLSQSILSDVSRSLGRPAPGAVRDLVLHEPVCLAW